MRTSLSALSLRSLLALSLVTPACGPKPAPKSAATPAAALASTATLSTLSVTHQGQPWVPKGALLVRTKVGAETITSLELYPEPEVCEPRLYSYYLRISKLTDGAGSVSTIRPGQASAEAYDGNMTSLAYEGFSGTVTILEESIEESSGSATISLEVSQAAGQFGAKGSLRVPVCDRVQ